MAFEPSTSEPVRGFRIDDRAGFKCGGIHAADDTTDQ
jgi:hypothetical protein